EGSIENAAYHRIELGDIHLDGAANLKNATVRADLDKYAANVSGNVTLEAPYAFTVNLTSDQSDIVYDKYEAVANGKLHISGQARPFHADRFGFDDFTVKGDGVELFANGEMDPGIQVYLNADLGKLPVQGLKLGGKAQAQAVVSGTIDDPIIEGALKTEK